MPRKTQTNNPPQGEMVSKTKYDMELARREATISSLTKEINEVNEKLAASMKLNQEASTRLEHVDSLEQQHLREKAALEAKANRAKFRRIVKGQDGKETWEDTGWLPFTPDMLVHYKSKGFVFVEGRV